MLKKTILFLLSLIVLVPVCIFTGYAIGHGIAYFAISPEPRPHSYGHDRELFAAVYGILFIGGFLYAVGALFALYRFIKAIRNG